MNDTVYEGPRVPHAHEWPAVVALGQAIFFGGAESIQDAMRAWPMEPTPADTLAMFAGEHPVAVIGRLERDMLSRGHRLRLGYIGGVCTHADHRGQGLASTLLAAQLRQLREDGVDLVTISGGRGLYRRIGADVATAEIHLGFGPETPLVSGLQVEVKMATVADVDHLIALSGRESVRLIRPRTDWTLVLDKGHCAGRAVTFYLVTQSSVPVGYLMVHYRPEKNLVSVLELAGDRSCVLAGLQTLCRTQRAQDALQVRVPRGDLLLDLCHAIGIKSTPAPAEGTMLVLDFGRLLHKLSAYLGEHLPEWPQRTLHTAGGNGHYAAWVEGGLLQLDGDPAVLWALFGAPAGREDEGIRAEGVWREVVDCCLPLPLPSIYLNMI